MLSLDIVPVVISGVSDVLSESVFDFDFLMLDTVAEVELWEDAEGLVDDKLAVYDDEFGSNAAVTVAMLVVVTKVAPGQDASGGDAKMVLV
ncbi:hypothetical protein LTR37_015464 [Vermiconidia calcicola]|uniref:Uncharacterized protein n=1 Tax=Vermiconidia calcicola TaxID=1690605 RepID=A0ACC3MS81_9PEZI|nr:hypothetical protein LTR37_015464 [Vermiconidia calcicola]